MDDIQLAADQLVTEVELVCQVAAEEIAGLDAKMLAAAELLTLWGANNIEQMAQYVAALDAARREEN